MSTKGGSALTVTLILPVIAALIVLTICFYSISPAYAQLGTNSADLFKAATMISAGIAFGMSAIAAGLGISAAGSAAMSASAERPEVRSLGIIICGLAESIAIYGLIVALQLIAKI